MERSQTSIGLRKNNIVNNKTPVEDSIRSATAVDLRRHFAVKSVYGNTSSFYVKKKFNFRAASSHILQSKTPIQNIIEPTPYSHLQDERPKRSLFTLIRIGILFFGIELFFSLETALTVPILLQLKVPEDVYSLVWVLSPLLGVIIQPILGVMSDRCQSRFGRRRPFIGTLAFGAYIGISLILNGSQIGNWLGDKPELKTPIIGIIFVGLGVTFLDFCADSSDSPLRAFLLDVCNVDDQDTGLNIHAMLGGLGSGLGFILAAINWKKTFLYRIGNEFFILFIFASVVFFVTLTMTLTSVKEEVFDWNEINEHKPLISINEKTLTTVPDAIEESESKNRQVFTESLDDNVDEHKEETEKPITIKLLFKSMINMPKELLFVMICQLLGWMSVLSLTFFLTDFMGKAIYHGDPSADVDSIHFQNYSEGVKIGCWCLLANAAVSSIYAFILENFLLQRFSTKFLYFFGCLVNAILVACIFFTTDIYIIIFLCSSTGILITTVSTLPFQMLSEFHKDENYLHKSATGTKRGIGIDCSLLSVSFFLARTLVASYSSPLINQFGEYTIVVTCSIISFVDCIWISLVMIFPAHNYDR